MDDVVFRLRRILTLIPILRARPGLSVDELCAELGASRREVLADLGRIALCGVPPYLPHDYILVVDDKERGLSVDFADHFARPSRLTLREAIALGLAIETLPPLPPDLEEAAEAMREAVGELLRSAGGDPLERAPPPVKDSSSEDSGVRRRGSSFAVPSSARLSRRLTELHELVHERREVLIRYYSASSDSVSERWIRPYALVDRGGHHYLVSYCLLTESQRSFRADRVLEIMRRDGAAFDLPESFDAYTEGARIGPKAEASLLVRARFEAEIARWVREDFPAEAISVVGGGAVEVEFVAGSIPWAAQKILGYGEYAVALEPPELRAEICRRLGEVIAAS